MSPMVNRVLLNRYRLVSVVRQCGLATTYRAVDEQDGKIVAVKLVPIQSGNPDHMEREFDIGSRLSHHNLVRYYNFFRTDDLAGLVTEFVEGESFLGTISRHEPNTFGVLTVSAFRQLVQAIAYLHDKGLVHANLSPTIILWTRLAELKLIDLGHCEELLTGINPWTGHFHGRVNYSSPEHERGSLVIESDYFVVGVLLVEHLTGANPFYRDSMAEVLSALQGPDTTNESMTMICPPLPERWRDIVRSLLSAAPKERRFGWRELMSVLEAGGQTLPYR